MNFKKEKAEITQGFKHENDFDVLLLLNKGILKFRIFEGVKEKKKWLIAETQMLVARGGCSCWELR